MKFLVSSAFILLFAASGFARIEQDRAAILKMQGCYKVNFDFAETFVFAATPAFRSASYAESGVESVIVDKDEPNEIHLQHILVSKGGLLKHWRQEWRREPTSLWTFDGRQDFLKKDSSLVWSRKDIPAVRNVWKQTVTQVDDSPRYECAAPWIHSAGKSFWECSSPAPLPRREFSKRDDYDVLMRRNRHEITSWGWMHEQDNQKIQSAGYVRIAEEKGYNRYTTLPSETCETAVTWWSQNKVAWNVIQEVWMDLSLTEAKLVLKPKVAGQNLWMELFQLAEQFPLSAQQDVNALKKSAASLIQKYRE